MRLALAGLMALLLNGFAGVPAFAKGADCTCDKECMTKCHEGKGSKTCKCKCGCATTGKCKHGKCHHGETTEKAPEAQ